MICPFRNKTTYEIKEIAGAPVLVGQEESYPECYENDCPYYDYYDGCKAIENED